jgi:hypothetical protein
VPCDKIPWQDPVIGWSMAAWNVVFCGLAGAASVLVGLFSIRRHAATV